jgi:hypothetical protein
MQSFKRSLVLAVAVFMLGALAAAAAVPNVRQDPGGTVVDGSKAEWNTTIGGIDYFSAMCTGNDVPPCTGAERGDVFLRYNCSTHTLYALMLSDRGYTYTPGQVDNWIAVGGNTKVVSDGAPFTTNSAAPMWRDLTTNDGAEASLDKDQNGANLVNGGTYQINFHIEVNTTQTSGTKLVTVVLPCAPTAVSVSTISAESTGVGINLAVIALSAAGLVVLGGLVFVAARKR